MTVHTATIDWTHPPSGPLNSGVMAPDDVYAVKIANVPKGVSARQMGHVTFGQFSDAQLEACMSQNEGDFNEQLAKSHVGPTTTCTDYIYLTGTNPPGTQWGVQLDPGDVYFNVRRPAADGPWAGFVMFSRPK